MQNGFTITLERYGKGPQDSIMFTGSVAQAEKVFGLKIVSTDGASRAFANTSDPLVPARIAALVERIDGLDNTGVVFPLSFQAGPQPSLTTFIPSNLYSTYNETPLSNAGISGIVNGCIAIVALSNYSLAALAAFDSAYSIVAPIYRYYRARLVTTFTIIPLITGAQCNNQAGRGQASARQSGLALRV